MISSELVRIYASEYAATMLGLVLLFIATPVGACECKLEGLSLPEHVGVKRIHDRDHTANSGSIRDEAYWYAVEGDFIFHGFLPRISDQKNDWLPPTVIRRHGIPVVPKYPGVRPDRLHSNGVIQSNPSGVGYTDQLEQRRVDNPSSSRIFIGLFQQPLFSARQKKLNPSQSRGSVSNDSQADDFGRRFRRLLGRYSYEEVKHGSPHMDDARPSCNIP